METMRRKINLLYLLNGFHWGGAETKLAELIEQIDKKKFNVFLIVLDEDGPLRKRFEQCGAILYRFPRKCSYDISLIFKLWRFMRKEHIDVVQTTLFYADVLGAYAAALAGIKNTYSWITISYPPGSPDSGLKHNIAYRLATLNFRKVIVVSNAIGDFMVEYRKVPREKIQTIYYGVDLMKFDSTNGSELRNLITSNKRKKIVGTVARLHEQKGHTYLIKAAEGIIKQHPDVLFVFVGDGQEREKLETQVRSMNLESYFKFMGFQQNVTEYINAFDIFVLPSLYEGLPNVILEAMACRKPVIATTVDGNIEAVVDNETGFLVPPREPNALLTKINQLLSDMNMQKMFGQNGRKRVEDIFSLQKQVAAFEKLYVD